MFSRSLTYPSHAIFRDFRFSLDSLGTLSTHCGIDGDELKSVHGLAPFSASASARANLVAEYSRCIHSCHGTRTPQRYLRRGRSCLRKTEVSLRTTKVFLAQEPIFLKQEQMLSPILRGVPANAESIIRHQNRSKNPRSYVRSTI